MCAITTLLDQSDPLTSIRFSNSHDKPLIQLRQLTKIYETEAESFPALKGINANFYPGEFIGIIGKSGAGKTTLVNMITGVDHLSNGEVLFKDTSVHKLNEAQRALWRGLNLGVVYQFFQLMPMLTLLENVMLPMDFCGLYQPGKSEKQAYELLRMVGLEDHIHKLPSAISGGQQQRVAIARALANNPSVIVADEPTGSLDSATAETIFSIFEGLARQGKTIILVTHDRSIAQRVSRVIQLADGEITEDVQTGILFHE